MDGIFELDAYLWEVFVIHICVRLTPGYQELLSA